MSKDSKVLSATENRRPPNAGKGRPKGVPNKVNGQLKDMILQALDGAGGAEYLQRQADENPAAFMSLVGKVLPMTVQHSGHEGGPMVIVTGIPMAPDAAPND
jgi:hypothetical protein